MSAATIDALCERATALLALNRDAEALDYAERALAAAPDNGPARRLRAQALLRLGRHREAATAAREAIAVEPAYEHGYRLLAWALLAGHQARDAIEAAAESVRLMPNLPDALYTLGCAHLAAKTTDDALAAARVSRQLLADHPHRTVAHQLAADVAFRCGRPGDAEKHLLHAARLDPGAETIGALADLRLNMNRTDDAARLFVNALETDPNFDNARIDLESIIRRPLRVFAMLAAFATVRVYSVDDVAERVTPAWLALWLVALVAGGLLTVIGTAVWVRTMPPAAQHHLLGVLARRRKLAAGAVVAALLGLLYAGTAGSGSPGALAIVAAALLGVLGLQELALRAPVSRRLVRAQAPVGPVLQTTATVRRRIGAAAYDLVVVFVTMFPVMIALGISAADSEEPSDTAMWLALLAVDALAVAYLTVSEATGLRGWGARQYGLRTVRARDGAPVGWVRALLHSVLKFAGAPFILLSLWFSGGRYQAWHDRLLGIVVTADGDAVPGTLTRKQRKLRALERKTLGPPPAPPEVVSPAR